LTFLLVNRNRTQLILGIILSLPHASLLNRPNTSRDTITTFRSSLIFDRTNLFSVREVAVASYLICFVRPFAVGIAVQV